MRLAAVAAVLLAGFGAVSGAAHAQTRAVPEPHTRLVLLGTAGGPSAKKSRAQPASAVIVNEDIYIVDAGDGVVRQLELGGYPLADVRAVFITHNHSDHVAGYGPLLLRAWLSGRRETIFAYGPAPIERMTADYLRHMRWDVDLRVADEGRRPLDALIDVRNVDADGLIHEDENLTVRVFTVDHGAAKPAYGYRFDSGDRSIVFSGDTRPSRNLIRAAQGADILVHEVVSTAAVGAMVDAVSPGNDDLRRHIVNNHTTPEQLGEIASSAGVHTLVLSHFGGTGHPEFDRPERWEALVRKTWSGRLIVGEDLMVIE